MKREEEDGEAEASTGAETSRQLVQRVREALIEAAVAGWEDAALAGLCDEGAFEAAVGRMRSLELELLVDGGGEPTDSAAIIGR